jgi:zinc protease
VAGDFEKAKILASLEKALEGWAAAPEPLPNRPPEVPREYRGGHYVVPMRGVTQTNIRMGHVGPKQATEERVVCDVMNLILGGGSFWSRMTRVVRTKEGLAYDVNSMFTRASQGGAFQASTQTKAATTYRAIALMLDLIREIREKPVSADELGQAKDFIVNRFVHNFENPGALAAQYARLEFEGYPENWLQRYLEVVKSVTVEDVQRAAKEWLRPDGLSIVVVGDPSLLDAPPAGFPEAKTLAAE